MRNIRHLVGVFLLGVLSACGGGGTLDNGNDGGSGGTPTPTLTISLSLVNASDTAASKVSYQTPLTLKATVKSNGAAASGKLVSFSLSNTTLASFNNSAGTAQTDSSGVAQIGLLAGSSSGAGKIIASLDSGETAEITFESAGDLPTTEFAAALTLTDPATALSKSTPKDLVVQLTSLKGKPVADQLVTFTLSDTALADFDNAASTAVSNSTGQARIALTVGTKSGSGIITATVDGETVGTVTLTSAGDKNDAGQVNMTLTRSADIVDKDNRMMLTATLTSSLAVELKDRLIKFTLDDSALGYFSNATGTVTTDDTGKAIIYLYAGTKSGAGKITATVVDSTQTATTTFTSAGDGGVIDSKPVGSIVLYADKLQLGTGQNDKVQLTALVRDSNNVLMSDVKVQFQADSNSVLQVENDITGTDGSAKAYLKTSTSYDMRDVVVSVIAGNGDTKASLTIRVTGNTMEVAAPETVVINSESEISVTLLDSEGVGIPDVPLTVTSSNGNTITPTVPRTGLLSGIVKFKYKALNSNAVDNLTIQALCDSGNCTSTVKTITINPDEFAFTSSATNIIELPIDIAASDSVMWNSNNAPKVGESVQFAISRGAVADTALNLSNKSVANSTTNGSGIATIFMKSSRTGLALLSAETATGALSASRLVEFIATNPSKVETQVTPAQIGIGESAVVRAVVRDASNHPVKNQYVVFSLVDGFGGQLSPITAVTNSQGVATTTFTADITTPGSGTPSDPTGLKVRAALISDESIRGDGSIAVGQRTLFFRFGTGNVVSDVEQSVYKKQFAVLVTDSSGNAVPNQALTVAVYPKRYDKGVWRRYPAVGAFKYWVNLISTGAANDCGSEDVNRNGILDAGEDTNNDKMLTPGNVASVVRNITADSEGIAYFDLSYPQDYGSWVDVDIVVRGTASGTENEASRSYRLETAASVVTNENAGPADNPFGSEATVTLDADDNYVISAEFCSVP